MAGVTLLAIAAGVVVYLYSTRIYVKVANNTAFPMQNVSIIVADNQVWSGELEAGDVIVVASSPSRDGSINVRATWKSRNVALLDCGYVTPNIGIRYDLALQSDGTWGFSVGSYNVFSGLRWEFMQWNRS